jgi:hypothetical protein
MGCVIGEVEEDVKPEERDLIRPVGPPSPEEKGEV